MKLVNVELYSGATVFTGVLPARQFALVGGSGTGRPLGERADLSGESAIRACLARVPVVLTGHTDDPFRFDLLFREWKSPGGLFADFAVRLLPTRLMLQDSSLCSVEFEPGAPGRITPGPSGVTFEPGEGGLRFELAFNRHSQFAVAELRLPRLQSGSGFTDLD